MPDVLDPGFITYAFRATKAGDSTELANFGLGYGVRILAGAACIKQLRMIGRAEFTTSAHDFHDGQIIAAPRGFARLVVDWSDDAVANVSRIVVEVLTVPAAVWATTDGAGAQGSRMLFEASVHVDPNGSLPTVPVVGTNSGELLLCEVKPGDFYQGPEGPSGVGVATAYPSRAQGDERPRWYPTAGLYFDGFLATTGSTPDTDLKIIIVAFTFSGAGTVERHYYRELASSKWKTMPTPLVSSATTTTKTLILADEGPSAAAPNYYQPLPVPIDGFQVWAKNSHAVNTYTLYGRIGARSG